ncbi:MAG: BON domain-containing protein [Candidatus Melainabacteria bacterium]|nr:BON domain-containing protein [Candidatus Melainabacteria bacterium]
MQMRKIGFFALVALTVNCTAVTAALAEDAVKAEQKFEESQEKAPNNSSKNARDEKLGKATAQNQSPQKKDVEITRELRKAIMATNGMSVDGQNVKIITRKGIVTLRGPVSSESEKNVIGDLVKNCSSVVSFTNQLEIKGRNSSN